VGFDRRSAADVPVHLPLGLPPASLSASDLFGVSPHGGRRFWPADVDAYASGGPRRRTAGSALDAIRSAVTIRPGDAVARTDAQPVAVPRPPHRAPTRLEGTSRRPSWPRFEATIERVAPGYLSFRDAEHVTRYVEARATLEIEASRSVEERLKA
jgi:hypothetical protein